ncbi:hypothetical protein B0H21DRAFT_736027 [Amylocystis lapponica]|nr:hypothetical protein B0H21DRAFT_736027 [Amylocystis lapponica]
MAIEDVPSEMWMEIFEWLPSSVDLYHVSITCLKFHDLAVRALHRHVVWRTPEVVSQNLPVWDANPGMELFTHTLELGVSMIPMSLGGSFVQLTGDTLHLPSLAPTSPVNTRTYHTVKYYTLDVTQTFASQELHDAMFSRIGSFTNLHTLIFHNMILSNRHLYTIHDIRQLRTLRIDFCVVPPRAPETLDHSVLPIIELSLLNLRRRVVEMHGDRQVTVDDDIRHVLQLSLAHNLRTLRVDSTADVFRNVFTAWEMERHGKRMPAHLERLYVQRKQYFRDAVQPTYPNESTFPDGALHAFLTRATELTTYATYHPGPPHTYTPDILPQLHKYMGPVETIALVYTRPMEGLGLLKCGYGANRDGVAALASLSESFPSLRSLFVEFRAWDDEIMHAISLLYRDLRRLKIVYTTANGGPNENTLVRMGPEFLARMVNLQTLHMYAAPVSVLHPQFLFDPSYASIEEELRNLVIPWNRWCPALREVQIHAGYTMSRKFAGGAWQVTAVNKVPAIEEFEFL